MKINKKLSTKEKEVLLKTLQTRFEKNKKRHANINWLTIEAKLEANPDKLWSLSEMEKTGGEPDVVSFDKKSDEYFFYDCSPESPAGRRSVCYDPESLASRKEHKPKHSAEGLAKEMGIEILDETQYRELQQLGSFDNKTSSWLKTPSEIRKLGGAIFGDFRFNTVFVYHNGAESYYAGRGFRGCLKI